MKIPQEKIQKLAEYTYFMNRKAKDYTPYAELSKADKQSYLNEANEQIEYINANLEIIGASQEAVDELFGTLASTMKHSVLLMEENADLKQKLASSEESIHDTEGKMRVMQEHIDRLLMQSNDSSDMLESVIDERDALMEQTPTDTPPTTELTAQEKNDYVYSCITADGRKVKDGKALLCKTMGVPLTNKRAETGLWIHQRISQNGWDAVELACKKMIEVCDGAV